MSGVTRWSTSAASSGKQRRAIGRRTVVVGANFERLVTTHNEAGLAVLLVLEQAKRASTALLPLARLLNKSEHLASHVEDLFLGFLVCNCLDLLGEFMDGLKVDILGLGSLLLATIALV